MSGCFKSHLLEKRKKSDKQFEKGCYRARISNKEIASEIIRKCFKGIRRPPSKN